MQSREEIERAVVPLIQKPLWRCSRAADLAAFHFGERHRVLTFRGEPAEVGDYALHVQCAWRIVCGESLVVGNADLYRPADPNIECAPSQFDWDKDPNRLEKLFRGFFADGNRQFRVLGVEVGLAGALSIGMEDNYDLQIFPNQSAGDEYWRLFRSNSNQPHFVFGVDEEGARH